MLVNFKQCDENVNERLYTLIFIVSIDFYDGGNDLTAV